MKIAILGGSFNPIHIGHLILADFVCTELNYDKVLFIPVYNPPHKEMNLSIDDKDRLEMVKLAVKNDSRFEVESCELDRGGISFTWDTVCYLEEKYKNLLTGKIGLIIGSDLLNNFDKWKNSEKLASKCDLILATRSKDFEIDSSFANKAKGLFVDDSIKLPEDFFQFEYKKLSNPMVSISSTDIRARINKGKAWRYLVCEEVFNYIEKRKLYGFNSYK